MIIKSINEFLRLEAASRILLLLAAALAMLAVKSGLAKLPKGVSWLQLYGVACLCGIGFTMSLFISSLAFEQVGSDLAVDDRPGILLGSIASAVLGYVILLLASRRKNATVNAQP